MWQTVVIALGVLAVLVLGLTLLQSAEFRSVFRRTDRSGPGRADDHMAVKRRRDRDSPGPAP